MLSLLAVQKLMCDDRKVIRRGERMIQPLQASDLPQVIRFVAS